MDKSNVIKILKTQYKIHIPKFIVLILWILVVSLFFFVILRQQFEYIPLAIPVYSSFIFPYAFLKNNETTLYIISGCSRKDIAITNFIVYLFVSIFFILNYILISVLFFGVNNLFFIHINIILIGLSAFNILICIVLMIIDLKYKKNISMALRIILVFIPLLLPRLIAKYQFPEEFTKPSNLMIFVFLYIISLIIHLLFNNYILSKKDFTI